MYLCVRRGSKATLLSPFDAARTTTRYRLPVFDDNVAGVDEYKPRLGDGEHTIGPERE